MAKPNNLRNSLSPNNNQPIFNSSQIHNPYVELYFNHFIKKFRHYNSDEFKITISGLNNFIDNNDKFFDYLINQFEFNIFNLVFNGGQNSINSIKIQCNNLSRNNLYDYNYQIHNLPYIIDLSSRTNIPLVGIIIMQIIAHVVTNHKILYKAIVLDLDDTLWKGTLSEVGIAKIKENLFSNEGAPFIAFMKFVQKLAVELGIFISLCSRNDSKLIEDTIATLDENIFPIKNQIDYIIANNNDKSENILKIAEHLSILKDSIVFIDDNPLVRDEVKNRLPEVFVPEWKDHTELLTQLIVGCIFERSELSINSQNRRKQYKIIQIERSLNTLPYLKIKVNIDYNHVQSINLYSKTNQFNFSLNDNIFDDNAKSLFFEILRENGENLGICSALTYTISNDIFLIHNWAISCRYFEIGLEEFILLYLQKIATPNKIFINYNHSDFNLKVNEFLLKYFNLFKFTEKSNIIEVVFTNEILSVLNKNTNLMII